MAAALPLRRIVHGDQPCSEKVCEAIPSAVRGESDDELNLHIRIADIFLQELGQLHRTKQDKQGRPRTCLLAAELNGQAFLRSLLA